MTEIIELSLLIFLLWFIVNLCFLIWRRLTLVHKLRGLCRVTSAEITYLRSPLLSLLRQSADFDLTVRVGSTLYAVRLYNGGGIGKVVHFASQNYSVRFSRMKSMGYNRRSRKSIVAMNKQGFAVGTKVMYLPDANNSKISTRFGDKVVPVWIFNPAPGEVSYVTEQKTSISVAFTGDEVYGYRIFTASTFVSFAEREWRNEKMRKNEENSYFYEFNRSGY